MVHKILFEATSITPYEFENYLSPQELVRGQERAIQIYATNIGKTEFAGGIIENVWIDFSGTSGFSSASQVLGTNLPCPTITKNKTLIFNSNVFGSLTGLAWLHLKMKASDNQPIEYYKSENRSPSTTDVVMYFYVVDREALAIKILLEELLKRFPR